MTARSGADSGNDDEEEDGVWGCSPAGFMDRDKDEVPTVEYFSLTVNFACILAQKCYKFAEKSVGLLELSTVQTPMDVQPCFALILSRSICS